MKIAIIGSHGTGKTTLAKALSQRLSLPLIPDTVIEGKKAGQPADESTTAESQTFFLSRHLQYLKQNENAFVSDKAVWDFYIYAETLLLDSQVLQSIRQKVQEAQEFQRYDFVFFVPIEFQLKSENQRSDDEHFQWEVQRRYLHFLKINQITFTEIRGTIETRIESALQIVRSHSIRRLSGPNI